MERSIFLWIDCCVVMAMMLIGECCNVGSLVVDDYLVVGNVSEVYFLKFGGRGNAVKFWIFK